MATQRTRRAHDRWRPVLSVFMLLVALLNLPPLVPAPVAQAAEASWEQLTPLLTPRINHSTTLLPDGRLLVAGGQAPDGSILNTAELYDPTRDSWIPTGEMEDEARDNDADDFMRVARWHHSAVLLPTGKVLVVGGSRSADLQDGSAALNSVELYDPLSNSWSLAAPMSTPRIAPTLTVLRGGFVLVAGGAGPAGPLASAELYDVGNNSWIPAGSMAEPRWFHSAARLDERRVLVVGGANDTGTLASAEIYTLAEDPASRGWSSAPSLAQARQRHTATVLGDGSVLVAGGFDGSGQIQSSELYSPGATTWSSADMPRPLQDHSATLLPDGRLLVAGGLSSTGYPRATALYDPASDSWADGPELRGPGRAGLTATLLASGQVLLVGGGTGAGPLGAVDRFGLDGGGWAQAETMTNARRKHTTTLLPDGRVLVAGGYNDTDLTGDEAGYFPAYASTEIYIPATNSWQSATSLTTPRFDHSATLLPDGRVLVVGGENSSGALRSAERSTVDLSRWTATAPMSVTRALHTATLLHDGRVLVVGGANSNGALNSAEIYDPVSNTWQDAATMATPRFRHTATLLPSGKVLVVGGNNGTAPLASAEIYDPTTDEWRVTGNSLSTERYWHTATLLPSGEVLVVGGNNGTAPLASAEIYDPTTDQWRTTGSNLSTVRYWHTATLLPNGEVLVAGGENSGGALASAEIYDPATERWSSAGDLATPRSDFSATLLADGRVLAVGGFRLPERESPGAELYTPGPEVNPSRVPEIKLGEQRVVRGALLVVAGSGFEGPSEASSGNAQSSPTNYPLVRLQSLANGQVAYLNALPNRGGDSFSRVYQVPLRYPPGHALASLVVAGIAGPAEVLPILIGSTRFVAPDGVDEANTCLVMLDPCATITHALNQNPSGGRIDLANGTYTETLVLTRNVALTGGDADQIVINGGGAGPTISVAPGVEATIRGLTITGGAYTATGDGGGGITNHGSLRLEDVTLRENSSASNGGGIANYGNLMIHASRVISNSASVGGGIFSVGELSIYDSTISGNVAATSGGGIGADGSEPLTISGSVIANNQVAGAEAESGGGIAVNTSATVTNSTISGNSAPHGAGIDAREALRLHHVTIVDNQATGSGGGLLSTDAIVSPTLSNSIVAQNSAANGPDCLGEISSLGGNLVGNSADCAIAAGAGDQLGGPGAPLDPGLGPLAENGGYTVSYLPLPGSPAIDAGSAAACGQYDLDQRGVARTDGACDSGAVEATARGGATTWYVARPGGSDANDCTSPTSPCPRISSAVQRALSGDTIIVAAGRYPEFVIVNKPLTIIGAGRERTVIAHNNTPDASVFAVTPGTGVVHLSGFSLRGGNGSPGGGITNNDGATLVASSVGIENNRSGLGSGIYNGPSATLTLIQSVVSSNLNPADRGGGIANRGTLTVVESQILNNDASNGGGGGIHNDAGATVSILRSTVAGNTAPSGGGLQNHGHATIENSTFANNSATTQGGAILNTDLGDLEIRFSTIALNRAVNGAGIYSEGSATIANSILARNPLGGGANCWGSLTSLGGNVFGPEGGCPVNEQAGDHVGDPGLGAFGYHGGPTATVPLVVGSAAVNVAQGPCPPTDQRGVARPAGPTCDSGAIEGTSVVTSSYQLPQDAYSFKNYQSTPDPLAFFKDFGVEATTHTISRTEVLSTITGLDALNMPISFAPENIDAVLPISITEGLETGEGNERVIPRPTAWLYEETVVEAIYEDADFGDEFKSAILGGLCVGMSSTAGAFKGRVAAELDEPEPIVLDPADAVYGSPDGSIAGIPKEQVESLLARFQGRQVGAQILNYQAGDGRYTPAALYQALALEMAKPEWWQNPWIIGVYQGSGCDEVEVGHALLPYRLEALSADRARIYVYDSNYPPAEGGPERFITLNLQANSWSYEIGRNSENQQVFWRGRNLFAIPLAKFLEKPLLPYLDGESIIAVGGRMRGSLGANFVAWGRMRGSLGEFDLNTSTGCLVTPDGFPTYVENISGSMRLRPLGGYLPQGFLFPVTDQPLTVTGTAADGQTGGDLLLFGPGGAMGFISATSPGREYSATIDPDFRTLELRTNDSPQPMSAFQMHETADGEATRVFAVSNVLVGNDGAISITVNEDLTSVTIANLSPRQIDFVLGLGTYGSAAIGSTEQLFSIEPGGVYEFTPSSWEDLEQPIIVRKISPTPRMPRGLVALYDFRGGSGAEIPSTGGDPAAPALRIGSLDAVEWSPDGLRVEVPTTLQAELQAELLRAFDRRGRFTLEFWAQPAASSTGRQTLLDVSDARGDSFSITQQLSERSFSISARLRVLHNGRWREASLSTRRLPRDAGPTHIVLTRDAGGKVRIYVNGVLRASERLQLPSSANLRHGGDSRKPGVGPIRLNLVNDRASRRPWLGTMRLFAIYDRALKPREVRLNYSRW